MTKEEFIEKWTIMYQGDNPEDEKTYESIKQLMLSDLEALSQHDVSGQSEHLCQWHDWVKHPSHAKIGAMICRNCGTELA